MGVIGLTAVEVLAFCLGLGLVLAVLIVVCNCVATCWSMLRHRRRKQKVEKLPEDYVDEIHRLLHRNQKPCEYDCVVVESRRDSPHLEKLQYISDVRVDPPNPSEVIIRKSVDSTENKTPRKNFRIESEEDINTNTTNSQSTITASENGDIVGGIPDGKSRRRTWGRLSSSLFETVMMPSLDTTTTEDEVDTISSIENHRYGLKIETTV